MPRRSARAAILAGLTLAGLPFIDVGSAQACSCAGWDDQQSFAGADAVFTGTLPGNDRLGDGRGDDEIAVTFRTGRVYKGQVGAAQPVYTHAAGATCGLELAGPGPFLIFARVSDERDGPLSFGPDGALAAGLCDGSRELSDEESLPFGAGTAPLAEPVATGEDGEGPPEAVAVAGAIGGVLGLAAVIGFVLRNRRR